MRELLFCSGWKFGKSTLEEGKPEKMQPVALPHDWLIYQPTDLYEDGIGWYEREITLDELKTIYGYQEGETVQLRFDGVYMNTRIYWNGEEIFEWKYGYSAFSVTLPAVEKEKNVLLVRVEHQAPNSRWYSGAGIYRDVTIRFLPKVHLVPESLYVHSEKLGACSYKVLAKVNIQGEIISGQKVKLSLLDSMGQVVHSAICTKLQENTADFDFVVKEIQEWSLESTNLYQVKAEIYDGDDCVDSLSERIGFRCLEFTNDKGLFVNGKHVKIKGVCEHHDLGCLGSAFYEDAMRRKMQILKSMGVNAIRTTHNMPAKRFMELADEMGFLIVAEAFDMWEKEKTTYDYARFFKEWYQKDVESWVTRDRNHPSIIMWSIGNEIYDTHAGERGQEITRELMEAVRMHDPLCNAPITIGSNYMPWENAQACADIVKFAGYNYGEKCYEEHHKAHPDWFIYGSETSSIVMSRGVYHFPLKQSILSDEDEQCSALGNSITSWGAKSIEKCIGYDRDTEFVLGQFIWTGFDYIGEPTPYHTRNSYFGQIDTAGFPKDAYYIYQSEWSEKGSEPTVHVFPYWNFNIGQMVDVRVTSNQPEVELFLNGRSLGRKKINHDCGQEFIADYSVCYEDGELKAVAYDAKGMEAAVQMRHSFGDSAEIVWKADREELTADGRSLCFVEIGTVDQEGYSVENAMEEICVNVEGPVVIAGMDNGDSTDTDSYKGNVRKLFNGKLLLVLQSGLEEGEAKVTLTGKNLKSASFRLQCVKKEKQGDHLIGLEDPLRMEEYLPRDVHMHLSGRVPLREIKLHSSQGQTLNEVCNETILTATLLPASTTCKKVEFRAVNDGGIEINYVKILPVEGKEFSKKIVALGDGEFRIRALGYDEMDRVTIISSLEFVAQGLGKAYLDPYALVSGGLYVETIGEIGNGNEKGFATARGEESGVIFRGIDFGEVGADKIHLPIFALSSAPYAFQIYEGCPGEDNLLLDAVYEKPSIWNTYQEECYQLNRKVTGVTDLCFVFHDKVHMKGFYFDKKEKAFERLQAVKAQKIYGDSFTVEETKVSGIGNNVTLEFEDMDFGTKGTDCISIKGYTPLEVNTIHIRFLFPDGSEMKEIVEFVGNKCTNEQEFHLTRVQGKCKVNFVFLPGCQFDFVDFCFKQA